MAIAQLSQIAHLYIYIYICESSLAFIQSNCDEQFRHLKLAKIISF